MKLKKVMSGLLASVMVFSSVVSGMPVTAAGAQAEEDAGGISVSSGAGEGIAVISDDAEEKFYEVTAGKKVMVSEARGTSNGGAEILGVEPKDKRYWMGAQLYPFTFDENEGSGDYSDPQWIVIDLGYAETEFQSIALTYQEKGWPTKGRIETGDDTVNWDTIAVINRESADKLVDGTNVDRPNGKVLGTATYTNGDTANNKLKRFVRFYFEEVNEKAAGLRTVGVNSVKIIGKHTGEPVTSVLAKSIRISTDGKQSGIIEQKKDIDISAGSLPLSIVKDPENSSRKLIKWSSSNRNVAKVEGNSLNAEVKLLGVGRTYITATLAADETIKHTIELNVKDGEKSNVLAGNTAIVASEYDGLLSGGDLVEHITDGYVDEWHRWSNGRTTDVTSDPVPLVEDPSTLTIDLGRNGTEFDEVRISYFRNGAAGQYEIETSSDNGITDPWNKVTDIQKTEHSPGNTIDSLTANGLTVTNGNGTVQESIRMSGQNVLDNHFRRYVRFKFTGPNTEGKNWIAITELEIIGTQSSEIPPKPVQVTDFTLAGGNMNLTAGKGETKAVGLKVLPENATNKKMTWKTSNSSVATVDKNGNVTAVGNGTATIQARPAANFKLNEKSIAVSVSIPEITFNANGGIFADAADAKKAEIEVKDGKQTVTEPERPRKEDAAFVGWFDAAEDGNEVTFGEDKTAEVTGEATLYAHWDNGQTEDPEPEVIKITFNANEGAFGDGEDAATTMEAELDKSGKVKKPDSDPKRADHSFVAWFDEAQGGNEVKFDKNGVSENSLSDLEVKTLYAHWIGSSTGGSTETKMVTFHANGGRFQDGREQHDVNIVDGKVSKPAESDNPTKAGFTFEGWFTAESGGEKKAFADGTENYTESATLYAQWQENANITLSPEEAFSLEQGQTREITARVIPQGTEITWKSGNPSVATVAPKDGDNTKATVTAVAPGNSGEPTAITAEATVNGNKISAAVDVTVTAVQVTFDATEGLFSDGTKRKPMSADRDKKVEEPEKQPERDGYRFGYWYVRETDGNNTKVTFNPKSDRTFEAAETLYAHWDPVNTSDPVKVTFNANGGTFENGQGSKEAEATGGKVAKPADPAREGYTFAGWFTEAGDEAAFENNAWTVSGSKDVTLYAHWTQNQVVPPASVKVIFNANGGTFAGVPTLEVAAVDGKVIKPADPARDGYTFAGWFTEAADGAGTAVMFDAGGAWAVAADATLYAHWTQNPLPPVIEFKTGAEDTIGGITYKVLNAGKKTAVVKKGINKKKVSIPATVTIKGTSCKVVQIGSKAFKGYKKLQQVTLGKNVTTINKNAFQSCVNLKTITLKGTALKTVKSGAFKKTSSKLSVKVPAKIKKSKAKKNKLMKALKKGGNKKVKIK